MDEVLRDLIEQDIRDWPDGHPCRECGKLATEHPHPKCEEWS